MWGAYFCMGAYKHDMVVVIKMGAYIYRVLILCGCLLSQFYSISKYYFHTYKVNRNHTPFMNILKVQRVKYLWVHLHGLDTESTTT